MMASSGYFQEMTIKNTVRFEWKEKDDKDMPVRSDFIRKVILDFLKVEPRLILCIQRNGTDKYVDVTMKTEEFFRGLLQKCKEKEDEEPISDYKVISMCKMNFRVVTVHMYDGNVKDGDVAAFLSRYVKIISDARYIRDEFGIWNGKRQFQVLLQEDPDGFEGFRHPPSKFSIGKYKGYLIYSRQPMYCRKCKGFGHLEQSCKEGSCMNCGMKGHVARECRHEKTCNLCGEAGHLFKDCPGRNASYADAARGKWRSREEEEDAPLPPIENLEKELRKVQETLEKEKKEKETREKDQSRKEGVPVETGSEEGRKKSWADEMEEEENGNKRKRKVEGEKKIQKPEGIQAKKQTIELSNRYDVLEKQGLEEMEAVEGESVSSVSSPGMQEVFSCSEAEESGAGVLELEEVPSEYLVESSVDAFKGTIMMADRGKE